MNSSYFVHAQIHLGQLIGIVFNESGFTFQILTPGSVEETDTYYPDQETALDAALQQAERNARWSAGFEAYQRGESLPDVLDFNFICGWRDAHQVYGRAA